MGKKKSFKPRPAETRTSFTYPSLHQQVANAVSDTIPSTRYQSPDSATTEYSNNEYPTNIMGKFICNNTACKSPGWGSKVVSIVIKGYPGNAYNAVVFNQRCKDCNQLGTFVLDETSYVDRIAYRLKIWARVPVERPPYNPRDGPPHQSSLCEGCKRGVCRRADD